MPIYTAERSDLGYKTAAPPAAPAKPNRRVVQLDVLRGVAILLVLCSHQWYEPPSGFMRLISVEGHVLGQTGVDLFFVLSGFLVGGLLVSEIATTGKLRIKNFWMRRGFKIWPAYYVFIAATFAHRIMHHDFTPIAGAQKMWPLLVNLQNYLGPFDFATNCWSLAVEEHFYFLLPLLILTACKISNSVIKLDRLPKVLIGLIGCCIAVRYITAFYIREYNYFFEFSTHLRMDALFFGVLLSYYHQVKPNWFVNLKQYRWILLGVGISLINFRSLYLGENTMFRATDVVSTYLGHGCLLLSLLQFEPGVGVVGKFLNSSFSRVLCFMGFYSYAIYLWHMEFVGPFVMEKATKYLPEMLKFPVGIVLYIAAATIFGALMARLIEFPMLRLRDRLFPAVKTPTI